MSALIKKWIDEFKNEKKIEELENCIIKEDDFIKISLKNSLLNLIKFDIKKIISEDSIEELENGFFIYNLSILNRSLIEMFLVYSSYFEKKAYKNNIEISPAKIFKYSEDDYSILNFKFDKAHHSMGKVLNEFRKINMSENTPEIYKKNNLFEKLLNYYNEQGKIINKIIHRYWSLPNRNLEITNFYEVIFSIKYWILKTLKIIEDIICEMIDWIKNGENNIKNYLK